MVCMASSSAGADRGASASASLRRGTYVAAALLLAAAVFALPRRAALVWTLFSVAALLASLIGVRMHPPRYRAPLWWAVAALACMAAAQVCVVAGAWPGHPAGAATAADVFGVAACVAAAGALIGCMGRRVPGWDTGFLSDTVIVIAAAGATVWLYFVAPHVTDPSASTPYRLTLAAYPTASVVLLVLAVMTLARVGIRRGEVLPAVCGVAGLVFSNTFLLVNRLGRTPATDYWGRVTWVDAGWLVFQGAWAAGLLHRPGGPCASAPSSAPRRPMTLTRLLLLLVVALANPLVYDIQSARGKLPPLGHFPIVAGLIFATVIVRLVFVGTAHLRSVRRLNVLLEAQAQVAGAQSATELAEITATTAAGLLGGAGQTTVVLAGTGRPVSVTCLAPSGPVVAEGRSPGDEGERLPDPWRAMVGDWPPADAGPGPMLWFLDPNRLPHTAGTRAAALVCPIYDAPARRSGKPLGLVAVSGGTGAVAGAAETLAVLAGQTGQGLERLSMAARLARRHLSAMTASIADAILIVDEDEVVRYANVAARSLFGREVPLGSNLADLVGQAQTDGLGQAADGGPRRWTLPGGSRVVEASVDDRRSDPTVEGFVVTLHDVTKLNVLEQQLRRRATHDPETGLENRLGFAHRLAALDWDDGARRAVLAVAVEHRAEPVGEAGLERATHLMTRAAERLASMFDSGKAPVARIDESTLALLVAGRPELPSSAAIRARVRAALSMPDSVDGHDLPASSGAGLAVDGRDRRGADLLGDALLALRAAQRQGPDGFAEYTAALRESSREQAHMRAELNEALRGGGLTLHYQPVVGLADRAPVAIEALARWPRPDGRFVSPEVFIPLAEQAGQIVPLGTWALRRALEDYCNLPSAAVVGEGGRPLRLNVNISALQLREPDFLAMIRGLLTQTGMPPGALVLEVTESAVVEQVGTLREARALGVAVAMDDFGTGYSSFSSLRRLPIGTLKIDKAFVDGVATDPVQYALVDGIVRMARELRLATVAEGIENQDQHDRLRVAGCQYGQGFLYSRPLPAAQLERWLLRAHAG